MVQKLEPSPENLAKLQRGFTEHWPDVKDNFDLVVLAVGEPRDSVRDIYAGFLMDVEASVELEGLYALYADEVRSGPDLL